jgi:hypothetical protein
MHGTKGFIEEVSTHGEFHEFGVVIESQGFRDDRSGTSGVVVLNAEVPHFLNTEFGIQVLGGQLGDNILAQGLMNLTNLPKGSRIVLRTAKTKVVLKVESKATHYRKMFTHFPQGVHSYLDEWGGVNCSVESIETTELVPRICTNAEVEVLVEGSYEELKGAA